MMAMVRPHDLPLISPIPAASDRQRMGVQNKIAISAEPPSVGSAEKVIIVIMIINKAKAAIIKFQIITNMSKPGLFNG